MNDFETIYREYRKPVYCFLLSLSRDEHLSEELAQETMFRAIMNIGSFRGDCKLSVWLFQIAKNLYFERQRKNKWQTEFTEKDLPVADDGDLVSEFCDRETAKQILDCCHRLHEPYREIFMLRALGAVPLKEIGRLFGKSDSWARVTYYRAKVMILSDLEKNRKGQIPERKERDQNELDGL